MKKIVLLSLILLSFFTTQAHAHCEIPCGIFADGTRFETMMENIKTIEKSMIKIQELSEATPPDIHAIARWTNNKEEHAQLIQNTAAQYFLTQRVRMPAETSAAQHQEDYIKHITLLHQIMVAAMKTKQVIDTQATDKLRTLVKEYEAHYFKPHDHKHH